MKRKIIVVINSRANYGRIKSFLLAAKKHPNIELKIIVGASALLYRFGNVVDIIKKDGFKPISVVSSIIEGENPLTMAKSTGLGIIELATHFDNIKPDIVLTVADRFETIATAIAASYMNIPVAHTQGGEVTGSIDDNVRHAITKLSHIHFPSTARAQDFLIKMGESKKYIFKTGCPAIDLLTNKNFLKLDPTMFKRYKGTGPSISALEPYLVVLQHPVTTEYGEGFKQINLTLKAVRKIINKKNIQCVWLWPNVDAGSDDVSKGLRVYREKYNHEKIHFYRNFSPEDYISLINNSLCLIGNSSSAIREGSYLGIPAVNIGSRQSDRERGVNVIDVDYDSDKIFSAINKQINHGRYKKSFLYGDGKAGFRIANILAKVDLSIHKKLNYLK